MPVTRWTPGCLLVIAMALAAAPAAADVTLSGTVRSQGAAVGGAEVMLQKMPGFQFIAAVLTDSQGHYSLTVPPDTYRVTVDPLRGPFIPQLLEVFSLHASKVQDFTLARGVTLSGQVRDPAGQLVPWAFVSLQDASFRQVSFGSTRTTGQYSLGAPPGTYRISIDTQARFIRKVIEEFVLDGAETLDVALISGRTLAGRVIDADGHGVPGVPIMVDDPGQAPFNEFFACSDSQGRFQTKVGPGVYVVTADPVEPFQPAAAVADLRSDDVDDLTLRVGAGPARFVPDDPPRAARIRVSDPDADGRVTVTGRAGAVPGGSHVVLVTLETGHIEILRARGDGRFQGRIWAPRGGSILVKADPLGSAISRLRAFEMSEPRMSIGSVSGLPGTIVRVPDPPADGAETPFAGGGLTSFSSGLPAWTFEGSVDTRQVNPGGSLRIRGTLRVRSPVLTGTGPFQVGASLKLERVAGADGHSALASNTYTSIFLTPTGLPIERQARFDYGIDRFQWLALDVSGDRAAAPVDMTYPVPADLPAGRYRIRINFGFHGVLPAEAPPSAFLVSIDRANRRNQDVLYGPVVRVGTPAAPRLLPVLLMDTAASGTRGVLAREDRGRAGVALRILTQSGTFVVPRQHAGTGEALRYRLEPFVPIVSVGDQTPPNPPLIPFRFPSGTLTVTIEEPGGGQRVLGPAPIVQGRSSSLVDRAGNLLDSGGGHLTDVYQLTTLDRRFEVAFARDGKHVIVLEGTVRDIWGNGWKITGTYDVWVASPLTLDTAVLPGTPFEVGDVFNPGLVLTPPRPADVAVRVRFAPGSRAADMVVRTFSGRANRFGYFQTGEGGLPFDQPGEYRVDVTATYREGGRLWMGTRTWGGVVAPRDPDLVARGRRGIDSQSTIGPQWFFRTDTGIPIGGSHVPFPFASGDIIWHQKSDAGIPLVTFQDPGGAVTDLVRDRALNQFGHPVVPLTAPGLLDERIVQGEAPLFSSRGDRREPHLDPAAVDLWAYSYRSVQRPLVRVREEIGEDQLPPPYWRFSEQYAGQTGVGRLGDLPNDFKFQYAGIALHGPALAAPQYAVYGSLFVLVPDDDPGGGTRTFPPFQGNPGGPGQSGGPIMRLKGRDIDLFLHLTGVRPGSVLETGDVFSVAGAVGPPLPARVSYRVRRPDGSPVRLGGTANRVGYFYDPADDFVVTVPGVYTVELTVTFDGATSAGEVIGPPELPLPSGNVLGTVNGRFHVFVVARGSKPLAVDLPAHAFLDLPLDLAVTATMPGGATLRRAYVTVTMPGFVLEQRDFAASGRKFDHRYDPAVLAVDFPNLDVSRFNRPEAADVITLTFFGSGENAEGAPVHAARVVVLHGLELFGKVAPPRPP
jgi:hypothetical protein